MTVSCGAHIIADEVTIADSFFSRFIGLMGKSEITSSQGLLLRRCSSVHCFFMRFPIDVVYLSGADTVLYFETVKPWHLGRWIKNTKHILELYPGTAQHYLSVGNILTITSASAPCSNAERGE